MLQHVAACGSVLQRAECVCCVLFSAGEDWEIATYVLQCVAVCCSVLCVCVCVCVLCALFGGRGLRDRHVRIEWFAACCSVLQRVVAYCSVLQCVVVRCSALQRVAARSSLV